MRKRTLRERLEQDMDIPSDMLNGGCHVTIKGTGEAVIYGCKSIVLYTEEKIELAMKHFTLSVKGERLSCLTFCEGQVVVTGKITAVLYGEGE